MRRSFLPIALFSVTVWVGCSTANEDPGPDDAGGGAGGSGGAPGVVTGVGGGGGGGGAGGAGGACFSSVGGTQHLIVYSQPGCGAQTPAPICVGSMGACAQPACSCEGEVIIGCTVFFEPYAYTMVPSGTWPEEGADCDPNGAGGAGGHAPGTGGAP